MTIESRPRSPKARLRVAATTFAATVCAALALGAGAASADTVILDTLAPATPATTFSVFGTGGPSIFERQLVGPAFTLAAPTTITEIGAFLNNCASIVSGVPDCPAAQPLTVQIRPSLAGAPDPSTLLGTFVLSHDDDPLTVSYESVAPGVVLAPGSYFALFAAQGTDAGFLLDNVGGPFPYQSGLVTLGFLLGGSPLTSEQHAAVRIVGRTDATAPVLDAPPGVVAPATDPSGAIVAYEVTATDDTDPSPTVECAPASGSRFAIGTTTVTCSATDASGNRARTTFDVHVAGAAEQLSELNAAVGQSGSGGNLGVLVGRASAAVAGGHGSAACGILGGFAAEVRAQAGKAIPTATADAFLASASRIRAVLAC